MGRVAVKFQIPISEDAEIGNGGSHPSFRWDALRTALYREFGGWTKGEQTAGVWRSEKTGQPVHDVSRSFEVDVEEERLDELRGLLRAACKTFVQQCIRMVVRGEAEYLQGGPEDPML